MRIQFRKRRIYNGKWYQPGDVVVVHDKYARAYIRVGAAIPAPLEKKLVKEPPVVEVKPALSRKPIPEEIPEIEDFEEEEEEDEDEEEISLEDLSYREIQKKCQEIGISATGSKADMIARLNKV